VKFFKASDRPPKRGEGNLPGYMVFGQGDVTPPKSTYNLGANSPRPPVDKFTNFMVEPFSDRMSPSALKIPSCIVARGLIFLPQNFSQLIFDSTVILRHERN
jgi:hypothetical protein